jgi:hypothetical protein
MNDPTTLIDEPLADINLPVSNLRERLENKLKALKDALREEV